MHCDDVYQYHMKLTTSNCRSANTQIAGTNLHLYVRSPFPISSHFPNLTSCQHYTVAYFFGTVLLNATTLVSTSSPMPASHATRLTCNPFTNSTANGLSTALWVCKSHSVSSSRCSTTSRTIGACHNCASTYPLHIPCENIICALDMWVWRVGCSV